MAQAIVSGPLSVVRCWEFLPDTNLPKIFFWEIQTFNEVLIEVEAGGELDVLDGVGQLIGLLPVSLR